MRPDRTGQRHAIAEKICMMRSVLFYPIYHDDDCVRIPKWPFPVAMCRHVDLPSSLAAVRISAGETPSLDARLDSVSFRSASSPARAK